MTPIISEVPAKNSAAKRACRDCPQRQPAETKESKIFQKNPIDSKNIQKNPKECKRIQKNQNDSRRFQIIPNDSKRFQKRDSQNTVLLKS